MIIFNYLVLLPCLIVFILNICLINPAYAVASANVSLDSPIYLYIDKLVGMGFIQSDTKGLKPYSKAEVARLVLEAVKNIAKQDKEVPALAMELVAKIRELIPRELTLKNDAMNNIKSRETVSAETPVYNYLNKLKNMGHISSPIPNRGTRDDQIRLTDEAAKNIAIHPENADVLAMSLIVKIREYLQIEHPAPSNISEKNVPWFDINPVASFKEKYVFLDGVPRDYRRSVYIPGGQSAFGIFGGSLRPLNNAGIQYQSGTEGTPLSENNNGISYNRGHNLDLRASSEVYLFNISTISIEPVVQISSGKSSIYLNKAYVKLGGEGLELEVGRDENWFGPGYRGSLTLTSNARSLDQIKLSSPEPLQFDWVKKWLGDLRYALTVSRFNKTDEGTTLYRQPYFIGAKLTGKPASWLEYGVNFVRQEGGPGFSGSTTIKDQIFGGGSTNHNNSIAGVDLRFRIPWLRNTEFYGEFAGEDSAGFWPIVESYVAGFYIPCLTSSCRDDLRFEFFWGNNMLYTDYKFPNGYNYYDMPLGHSQGGGTQDFFLRYSHFFSARNRASLEYFHTDRGLEGRVSVNKGGMYDSVYGVMQSTEHKNAVRVSWALPIIGDTDGQLLYGIEKVTNFNLAEGVNRINQLFSFEISYRY